MNSFFDKSTKFWSNSHAELSNVNSKLDALDILYQNCMTFNDMYFKAELKKRSITFNKVLSERNSKFKDDDLLIMESDYEMATNESLTILSNFIVVASYSYYEQGLKNIMRFSGLFNKSKIEDCYRNEVFLSIFNKEEYIKNIVDRSDYKKVNELRFLNNAIKHNGIVDKKLHSTNPKWITKESIKNTYDDFSRLKDGICELLSEIISKTHSNITT